MKVLPHEEALDKKCHLTNTGVLDGLSREQITDLEFMGVYMEYHEELVVADAQTLEYFFYIIKGRFEVSKIDPDTSKKCLLATIGKGESFGEMSFLTGTSASADVFARQEVIAWAIPHESLRQFIKTHPGGVCLSLNIATLLAQRIQDGNKRLLEMNSMLKRVLWGYRPSKTP